MFSKENYDHNISPREARGINILGALKLFAKCLENYLHQGKEKEQKVKRHIVSCSEAVV